MIEMSLDNLCTHNHQPLVSFWYVIEIEDAPSNLPKEIRSKGDQEPPWDLWGAYPSSAQHEACRTCDVGTHHGQDLVLHLFVDSR